MMKRLIVAAGLVAMAPAALAQSFAFTRFNTNVDGWALVALSDIAPGTVVYFQDNEWNGGTIGAGGAFNTGESSFSWNTGAATIAAGTVINFTSIDTAARAATVGAFSVVDASNTGLSNGNETLYAFLGTSATAPTQFLAAWSTESFALGQLGGTGLVIGQTAIQFTNSADFGQYLGPRDNQLTIAAYGPLVNDVANWEQFLTNTGSTQIANLTPFAPIPEPTTWALMLAGLGVAGFIARRRRG